MVSKVTYNLIANTSQRFIVSEDNNTYEFRFKMGTEAVTCDCIQNNIVLFLGKQVILGKLIGNFYILDNEIRKEDPIPEGFGTRWSFVYFRGA